MKEELEKLAKEWTSAVYEELSRLAEMKKLLLQEKPNRYKIQRAREAINNYKEDLEP